MMNAFARNKLGHINNCNSKTIGEEAVEMIDEGLFLGWIRKSQAIVRCV
jgi:hypothetical protein